MLWTVAALLAVTAAVLGGLLVSRGPSPAERRAEVLQVAETFAVQLSSYDYRHFDADVARVVGLSTGNFRAQYEQALAGESFREALRANRAVATARVVSGPFLPSLSAQEAHTFTIIEQRVTGRAAKPQVRRTRVETILVRTVQGWRVDRVDII